MKLAIHHREGSFSERWIDYCKKESIDYLLVNSYANDILEVIRDREITHFMWHFSHESSRDLMLYPNVFNSLELMGIKTFPNFNSRWHFENKVAQKYLFECIDAPMPKNYAFYDENEALRFLEKYDLPIVAKLKRGAASINVKLVTNIDDGVKYVEKLFSEGIPSRGNALGNLGSKIRIAKKIKNIRQLFIKIIGFLKKNKNERLLSPPEKGYAYFQEFMPKNDFDVRLVIVNDKAFGAKRINRENDFRASGSGKCDFRTKEMDLKFVSLAFELHKKIGAQCLAYDFVYNKNKEPVVIETCFSYAIASSDNCEGFWDENLNFSAEKFNPQYYMVENFIKE
jgi:glutathione synthase/RimK-type ligase-like ATP-grasp enzyme